WPLWLGSLIVGGALGVISYIVMYYTVDFYRRRHRARLAHKKLRAAEVRQEPTGGGQSSASGDTDPGEPDNA
ncbi:MAG: hypothetical protein QF662_04505, partial [Phycisphaerae bacterium]|nr:hypothetical protein [Phycisphaerae bacterium]